MNEVVRRSDVMKAGAGAMVRVGFERVSGEGLFVLRLRDDVLGWASHMATRDEDGAIVISPKVGVRHEGIHRVIDSLLQLEPNSTPTISEVLGHLMPQRSANVVWRFGPETPLEAQADDMAQAIVEYGRPMSFHQSLADSVVERTGSTPVSRAPGRNSL